MDGKLKVLEHEPMRAEEMEELLYEKYGLKGHNIEWMTVEDLVLEDLGEEKAKKAIFSIDKNEMELFAGRKLAESELVGIFSFIENDESIWNAIEDSKKEALQSIVER